jgi:hypothetical protein
MSKAASSIAAPSGSSKDDPSAAEALNPEAWWGAGEAFCWIAFRQFVAGGVWTDMLDPRPRPDWHVSMPEAWEAGCLNTGWMTTANDLAEALDERAARRPWTPTKQPPVFSSWRYRAAARRLARDTGLDAATMAAELRAELARASALEAEIEKARNKLRDAVRQGYVQAWGVPTDGDADATKQILPGVFEGNRLPEIVIEGGIWDERRGILWNDVELRAEDMMRVFPAASANTPSSVVAPHADLQSPAAIDAQTSHERPLPEPLWEPAANANATQAQGTSQEAPAIATVPPTHASAPGVTPSSRLAYPTQHRYRRGGRPPRDDWQPFDQELSRVLSLDGGDLTNRELRKRMKDWAGANMENKPDERTIERHIGKRVPDNLLPD